MFRKWKSIENSYQQKFIEKFENRFIELRNETFEITEKLDGSNFSITFHKDGHLQFSKRGGIVDDNFYNYKEAIKAPEMETFINALTDFCIKKEKNIQFIGEIFGCGIQKRANYGNEIYWRWYAIYELFDDENMKFFSINDEIIFNNDILRCEGYDASILKVPTISTMLMCDFSSIYEMMDSINIRINSEFTPPDVENNLIEGVVVRPMNNYSWGEECFMLKKKNPEFADNKPRKKREPQIIQEEMQVAITEGLSYVNENRTLDLFSKYGKLDDMKKFGSYIKYYMQDVMEDFVKDNGCAFDKKDLHIFNKAITQEIKKELRKEGF